MRIFLGHGAAQLRMYCIDTKALVFMSNGGSLYGFTIHPIFTRISMLYLHINNKKHVHHGFLAPWPYLCSTSLSLCPMTEFSLVAQGHYLLSDWMFTH